ncbi:MAG: histidine phosphatase family protein [Nocardioides sp.]
MPPELPAWDWASRVYAATERIFAQPWRFAVVVTHGGSLTYVVSAWIGMPLEAAGYVKFKASAGSVAHLCEDDLFHDRQVLTLNDRSHLGA